ncbi:acetyl-CoA carboxylase biotin carboxyl carrier protein [Fervidibacillus halotolerans]|uniref:Biotin carboxyl carrier protein of acetyl-CoA carboxylase n=1 Tax=Fervidibacillus halotolerans TaxID=2980027 RepID=A0A9E8LXE2_9BACI|nr:acetyl-CoA carboxylase biotin carboxyl carrier protein [Fervidibacillus halotolerans]WAA11425.1 acetyl-CoA carboxylase biotin carboxyl carrier protein [Fervidibacillus halotolerans]
MLKVQEIRELIRLIDQSGIDEFTYESNGTKLVMKKNQMVESKISRNQQPTVIEAPKKPVEEKPEQRMNDKQSVKVSPQEEQQNREKEKQQVETNDGDYHKIVSPMVGTFYRAPSPGAEPYVKVGSKVTEKTIVCIVEAMKLFNEIEADVKGEIVDCLVEDGQLVEYGQPLFLVKTE